MLADRQQKLNKHLKELKQLSDVNNALVLVTNEAYARPDAMWGLTKPIGGHMEEDNASTFRLYLRKSKGGRRIARLIDSLNFTRGRGRILDRGNMEMISHKEISAELILSTRLPM